MPVRIQRQRTKGWKAPAGAVYVGRPTRWKNPYRVAAYSVRQHCIEDFRAYLKNNPAAPTTEEIRRELRGKDLMCWCALDEPCHADVLLEIANGGSLENEA